MSNGIDRNMGMGQTAGAASQPLAVGAPPAPTVAARLTEAESKLNNLYDMMARAERIYSNLIQQNQEMREELGMAPLPPDYFS